MTEAVPGAFFRGVLLDPFFQRCTGRVGVCGFVLVVSGEGELAVPNLSHNTFSSPERGFHKRNGPSTAADLETTPWMLLHDHVGRGAFKPDVFNEKTSRFREPHPDVRHQGDQPEKIVVLVATKCL